MTSITAEAGFQAGLSAAAADTALKSAVREMDDARHRAVLWFSDIMDRRLYRMLGFSSMAQYATVELKFSKTRTGDFLRLAHKMEELPAVKKSLANGDLGYTKLVEIIKVATPITQDNWVAEASRSGRRDLAKKVKRVRDKARRRKCGRQGSLLGENTTEEKLAVEVPVRVALEMTPEQFARFEALMEKVRKQGAVPAGSGKVETFLAGLDALVRGTFDTVTDCRKIASGKVTRRRVFPPPFQVHVHRCPECGKSTIQTGRGEMEISRADADRVACDARIKRPGQPNSATIPPARRSEVLSRDRHRCQGPGCGNSRFLEVHHIKPRSAGGGNDPDNLVTLCSACHRLVHEGRFRVLEPTP